MMIKQSADNNVIMKCLKLFRQYVDSSQIHRGIIQIFPCRLNNVRIGINARKRNAGLSSMCPSLNVPKHISTPASQIGNVEVLKRFAIYHPSKCLKGDIIPAQPSVNDFE